MRLLIKYITGIPTAITTNSPIATVNQVNKKGNSNARFNSQAIKNIVKVKTTVFTIIRAQIPLMKRADKMVMDKANSDWPTPKTRS